MAYEYIAGNLVAVRARIAAAAAAARRDADEVTLVAVAKTHPELLGLHRRHVERAI